jgi:transposase-like protein
MNIMEAKEQNIIAHIYIRKESFVDAHPWFEELKRQGLNPSFITSDGELSVMRAINKVWPFAKIQRCLYHIQREGMRWLRTYPKTQAGKALRDILSNLTWIHSIKERDVFIATYNQWLVQYKNFVKSLPSNTVAFKDLKKATNLIKNALPNMFHYLNDQNIHKTTNALESFHSRLKSDYHQHRGLTKQHRIQYIHWYCYLKNRLK